MSRSRRKIHHRTTADLEGPEWYTVKDVEKTHKSRGRCSCYWWAHHQKKAPRRQNDKRAIQEQLD